MFNSNKIKYIVCNIHNNNYFNMKNTNDNNNNNNHNNNDYNYYNNICHFNITITGAYHFPLCHNSYY